MAVPLLDISRQHNPLLPQLLAALDGVLRSGKFVVPSPEIEKLEQSLASICATQFGLAVSSGTDALLAALMAVKIGPGDEVITTPFTFFATAGSIARVGAKPVFVDINPVTFNIDPAAVEAAITPRTKAIMPVHLFGLMADMNPLLALAKKHQLAIIEDAAQAIGSRYHHQPAGSLGDIGCLSFYPTKNLAALGDGGACVTRDPSLDRQLRAIRLHGQTGEYQHEIIGGNFRLDAMQAALLNVKISHLEHWSNARRDHAGHYNRLLAGLPVTLPHEPDGYFHVYNQYTIRVGQGRRDALRKHLVDHQIGNKVYYPLPLHLQPCFSYLGYRPGQLPHAEQAAQEVLSLPMFPEMTLAEQEETTRALGNFF